MQMHVLAKNIQWINLKLKIYMYSKLSYNTLCWNNLRQLMKLTSVTSNSAQILQRHVQLNN